MICLVLVGFSFERRKFVFVFVFDFCETPQLISPKSENTFSSVTKIFCLRDMIKIIY